MAKKGNRQQFRFKCNVCSNLNYVSRKNIKNTVDKVELKKYCKTCQKSTVHKEAKIERGKTN
jgi:large subunit ribosomal protein L33